MFRNTAPVPVTGSVPVTEPDASDDVVPADPIPISYLALDLNAPAVGGWPAYLAAKGIEVVADDLGRDAISRADARQLFEEKRADEARAREVAERREQQLIQQDRLRRANMPAGIPAGLIPDGMTGGEMMVLTGEKRRPRSVREQLLEKELAHSGLELVYQSIGPDAG
jgi:hypothetical protein